MTLSYPLRLMCLSLACLFALNFASSIILRCFAARAIRRAEHMEAHRAARFLLALRLVPAAFALFCTAALCVPSYLWLEPASATEQAGAACLIAAALGAALWTVSIARGARAAMRSFRYVRRCRRIGSESGPTPLPILSIPGGGRVVALAGVFRSQLVMSSQVAAALDPAQLDAVVRHELAHHVSRDNLKRLVIALAPGCFLGAYERAWKRFSEWAADDRAAAGDPRRATDLAMALVRVARFEAGALPPALATPLIANNDAELAARVDRLLQDRDAPPSSSATSTWSIVGCAAAFVGIVLLAPAALAWVHGVLERLMN
jgi:Zn-dependent protease with chaperone function